MRSRYELTQPQQKGLLEYELAIAQLNCEIVDLKKQVEDQTFKLASAADMVADVAAKRRIDQQTIDALKKELFEIKNSIAYKTKVKIV